MPCWCRCRCYYCCLHCVCFFGPFCSHRHGGGGGHGGCAGSCCCCCCCCCVRPAANQVETSDVMAVLTCGLPTFCCCHLPWCQGWEGEEGRKRVCAGKRGRRGRETVFPLTDVQRSPSPLCLMKIYNPARLFSTSAKKKQGKPPKGKQASVLCAVCLCVCVFVRLCVCVAFILLSASSSLLSSPSLPSFFLLLLPFSPLAFTKVSTASVLALLG